MLFHLRAPVRSERRASEDETTPDGPDMLKDARGARRDRVAPDFTGMRVLLVDGRDDRLARVLARDGHEVLTAENPGSAIRLSGVFDPEVVVVVGDSCRGLRQVAPTAGIIALVAGQDVGERVTALQTGADDCLASPWSEAELRARVRAMGRRRARVWGYAASSSPV
jgi:DNA-binding response OmpR family regulator